MTNFKSVIRFRFKMLVASFSHNVIHLIFKKCEKPHTHKHIHRERIRWNFTCLVWGHPPRRPLWLTITQWHTHTCFWGCHWGLSPLEQSESVDTHRCALSLSETHTVTFVVMWPTKGASNHCWVPLSTDVCVGVWVSESGRDSMSACVWLPWGLIAHLDMMPLTREILTTERILCLAPCNYKTSLSLLKTGQFTSSYLLQVILLTSTKRHQGLKDKRFVNLGKIKGLNNFLLTGYVLSSNKLAN